MGQLGFVEQTGHGVLEIIKHYGKEAFTLADNYINVSLKFPFMLTHGVTNYSGLNPSQINVLKAINTNPLIKTKELCEVTNLGTTRISEIIKT